MRCKSLTRQVSCQVLLRDLRQREENINSVKAWNLEIIIIVACCCHNSHSWDVKETHIACRPPINLHWSSFCGREQHNSALTAFSLSEMHILFPRLHVCTCFACLYRELFISLSLPLCLPFSFTYNRHNAPKPENANWQCWGEWMKASLDGFSLSFFYCGICFLCFFFCSIARFQFEFYAAHVQR